MITYNEEDYLMLSGIQHFYFCKRQWALIHIEQQWAENQATMEGNYLHARVDDPFFRENRKNVFDACYCFTYCFITESVKSIC